MLVTQSYGMTYMQSCWWSSKIQLFLWPITEYQSHSLGYCGSTLPKLIIDYQLRNFHPAQQVKKQKKVFVACHFGVIPSFFTTSWILTAQAPLIWHEQLLSNNKLSNLPTQIFIDGLTSLH